MHRLLVVDDDKEILELVQSVAVQLGFVTEGLSHSAGFMRAFVRFKPTIVAVDVVMPNVDGVEIIRWLSDVGFAGRVIVMSGNKNYSRMAVALARVSTSMSAEALDKPFHISDLRAALLKN